MKKVLCWNCGIYPAVIKSYRSKNGVVDKELNCSECHWLNNKWYNKVHIEHLDPKTLRRRK